MKRTPLKRGAPPQRRTPLRATATLTRRKGVNPVSQTRKDEQWKRDACRAVVLARDPICRYPGCREASTDVHELHRGAGRRSAYLDPLKCIGLCGFDAPHYTDHHRWVTEHPVEARALELAYWSWEEIPPPSRVESEAP